MTGHIYIYGEIENYQADNDYGIVSLKNVVDSINSQKEATEFIVHIHSVGGDVTEGLAIYDILKATGKKITTINEGACYSIATVIFLAGTERQTLPNADFVIHNELGMAIGSADDLRKTADEFEKARNKIIEIYKSEFNINEYAIRSIMKEDRIMETAEALNIGLATSKLEPLKAVAKFKKTEVKPKTKKMSKKTEKTILNKIKDLLGVETKAKNIVVTTADMTKIDFTELQEGDAPKKGDVATLESGDNPNGNYLMPDGTTYVFEDGELSEIIEKKDDNTELVTEIENLKKENEDLKAKLSNSKNDLEVKLSNKKKELKEYKEKFKSLKNLVSDHTVQTKNKQTKNKQTKVNAMSEALKNL